MNLLLPLSALLVPLAVGTPVLAQTATPRTVYRCPGPPVLYTDALTPEEARQRNCRTIEGAPVTVIQSRPRPASSTASEPQAAASPPAAGPAPARAPDARVEPAAQRSRDAEARRILEAELRREETRLEGLRREYNNGEPERRGDERNFQRYADRVAEMKAGIQRAEADIAALRRELAKLPAAP